MDIRPASLAAAPLNRRILTATDGRTDLHTFLDDIVGMGPGVVVTKEDISSLSDDDIRAALAWFIDGNVEPPAAIATIYASKAG